MAHQHDIDYADVHSDSRFESIQFT